MFIERQPIGIIDKKNVFYLFISFSQYGEDDEDEQSEDGDGSSSPRPFDR